MKLKNNPGGKAQTISEAFHYTGSKARAISFPLGGIGTGSIGLSGTGRFVDWEIFNRPNKNSYNGFSFFALKAEYKGEVKLAKVLHGDLDAAYMGEGTNQFSGFGFGVSRETVAGFPHFKNTKFDGRFPFSRIEFEGEDLLSVELTAFNPFIPMNEDDSSLPLASFEYKITNHFDHPLDCLVAGVMTNPSRNKPRNAFVGSTKSSLIRMDSWDESPESPSFGDMSLSSECLPEEVSFQEYWYRGEWFDNVTVFWQEFSRAGRLPKRKYDDPRVSTGVNTYNSLDTCTLGVTRTIAPGETKSFRFLVSWSYPNFVNYWNPGPLKADGKLPQWKNYYATKFKDSTDTAHYWWTNRVRLTDLTRAFQETLFASTVPVEVLDAVSANLSILKSPTCIRLTDGTLYGFEGNHAKEGCCEGSCTHVWNYEQAVCHLFPALARGMRESELAFTQFPNGKMAFRMLLPRERTNKEQPTFSGGRAAADGQMGGVIKAYREWKISGDTEWLRSLWPKIKKSLEYAWDPTNLDSWDLDRDGVMEGAQHHTLDVEIYGPNSYITTQYHAALLSAALMAEAVGDPVGIEYRELQAKGRTWVENNLFNGEYFHQKVDLRDPRYHLDAELGELKYQIAEGCHVDQVLGQWYAHLVGLGYLLDPKLVKSAVKAVHKHNFKSMRDHSNSYRMYAVNDEEGVAICTWPRGGVPKVPVPYADECMNGFEYQIASHLIFEGFTQEGLEIVRAVRSRYDGEHRNPWNEIECGSNYSRSMASYGLLNALSGLEYDTAKFHLGFSPRSVDPEFRCFWALHRSWGLVDFELGKRIAINLVSGMLTLKTFGSQVLKTSKVVAVRSGNRNFEFFQLGDRLTFAVACELQQGEELVLHLENGRAT